MFETPEEIAKARKEAFQVALFLDFGDYDHPDRPGSGIYLVSGTASQVLLASIIGLMQERAVVGLDDEAAWATQLFMQLGEDRQAALRPSIEGMWSDSISHWSEPESDPYRGFNERATAEKKGGAA